MDKLIADMLAGSRTALARVLTRVENRRETSDDVLRSVAAHTGRAIRIGFTGPPGAGKSTLVAAYARLLRKADATVGVLAVDPTSPFSGGALLGDRVRMNSLSGDDGVFVRSLATRGSVGGLAEAAGDMAEVLDAAGFAAVLFETVGVGQSEMEIVQHADSTVVVLVPESGDAIQGMKAGLMEIADVFVVNKADREGAERFAADLRGAVNLKTWGKWTPPVVLTVGVREEGLAELHEHISRHTEYLGSTGLLAERRAERWRRRVKQLVERNLVGGFWDEGRLTRLETAIREGRSPQEISVELLAGAR